MEKKTPLKFSRDNTLKLVFFALSKQGFWPTIDKKKIKEFHTLCQILCLSEDMKKRVGIRVVKSNIHPQEWTMPKKIEEFYADDFFYIFVGYENPKSPKLFIVPSIDVLEYSKKNAKQWLDGDTKNGTPHKDNKSREFAVKSDERKRYLNRWDLLGL